jgi:hypothetical protein
LHPKLTNYQLDRITIGSDRDRVVITIAAVQQRRYFYTTISVKVLPPVEQPRLGGRQVSNLK